VSHPSRAPVSGGPRLGASTRGATDPRQGVPHLSMLLSTLITARADWGAGPGAGGHCWVGLSLRCPFRAIALIGTEGAGRRSIPAVQDSFPGVGFSQRNAYQRSVPGCTEGGGQTVRPERAPGAWTHEAAPPLPNHPTAHHYRPAPALGPFPPAAYPDRDRMLGDRGRKASHTSPRHKSPGGGSSREPSKVCEDPGSMAPPVKAMVNALGHCGGFMPPNLDTIWTLRGCRSPISERAGPRPERAGDSILFSRHRQGVSS
jgi:hypothetical protein